MGVNEPSPPLADARGENRSPDPWGVRRAEVLLTTLKDVKSARVVVSPDGEITEIHVLTELGLTPKQVVRNVESALLAQLGIRVDHRRISVAQTAGVSSIGGPESAPSAEPAPGQGHPRRGILFRRVEVTSAKPNKVSVTVALECAGKEVSAQDEAADTPNMRLQAAARAAVSALDSIVDEGTLDLVGVQFVEAFDTTFVFVGVSVLTGRHSWLHTGTCQVRRGFEQAAALAVLDATNRWLHSLL